MHTGLVLNVFALHQTEVHLKRSTLTELELQKLSGTTLWEKCGHTECKFFMIFTMSFTLGKINLHIFFWRRVPNVFYSLINPLHKSTQYIFQNETCKPEVTCSVFTINHDEVTKFTLKFCWTPTNPLSVIKLCLNFFWICFLFQSSCCTFQTINGYQTSS